MTPPRPAARRYRPILRHKSALHVRACDVTYVPSVSVERRVVLDDELQLAHRDAVIDDVPPLELDHARAAGHQTHVERRARHLCSTQHPHSAD